MSSGHTDAPAASTPAEAADAVQQETRFGAAFVKRHGWRLLLVFAGLLLPLWLLGALVETLREGEAFAFDIPLLELMHHLGSPALDRVFLFFTEIGYAWGTVPIDVLLVLGLTLLRHRRESLFAAVSIIGSMLLNLAAKHSFGRIRPDLWPSLRPETTYSFPSGHAMGSMTLAMVVVLLCWSVRTRWGGSWRWPVTLIAAVFVLMVGASRIYLGVHYPSDILAGWTAASIWVVGVYSLVFYGTFQPWQAAAARRP